MANVYSVLLLTALLTSIAILLWKEANGRNDGGAMANRPDGKVERWQLDPTCRCRNIPLRSNSMSQTSTCDIGATSRGGGQKVISFDLHGMVNESQHALDLTRNAALVKSLYPGFTMRLYTNWPKVFPNQTADILCPLYCHNDHVDICNRQHLGYLGKAHKLAHQLWHLAPMCDPLVAEWHSRDVRASITEREVSAVDDWRSNTKGSIHAMRDHVSHIGNLSHIRIGLFGMRMDSANRLVACATFKTMLEQSLTQGGQTFLEQRLLLRYLCPWAKLSLVVHDSFGCSMDYIGCRSSSPISEIRPFPTRREIGTTSKRLARPNFVGALTEETEQEVTLETPCPEECRPKQHKDWIAC